MKNFKRVLAKCAGIVSVFCFGNMAIAQSKITCDLFVLSGMAFGKNPSIQRSFLSIKDAEANFLIQKSMFDFNLGSDVTYKKSRYNLFENDPRNQYLNRILTDNVDLTSTLSKKFRTGQTAEFGLQYSYNRNNYPFNDFSQSVGPNIGNHSSYMSFTLSQPLLRGRGNVNTLYEKISALYIENSKHNFEYSNSYEILQIANAYWSYYTAYKSVDIYRQNEARVRNVLEMTKELVKADKKPAGDLAQVNADLANQERLTIAAEQNLYNAKLNLGRVIGLSESESAMLDVPVNDFPSVVESGFGNTIDKEALINMALEKRADIKAVARVAEAIKMEVDIAHNNLRPQLDLSGFVFYGSASVGNGLGNTFNAFSNYQGRNFGGGARLTFNFPLNNNLAKGNYAKAVVASKDQAVNNENLKRNILLNITTDINNLNSSVIILNKAEEALMFYKEAFRNEQEKFQTGLTTLLNVILFQERLTSSELDYLQAQQIFANQIVTLRHDTGTLISQGENGFTVDPRSYYTIPNN